MNTTLAWVAAQSARTADLPPAQCQLVNGIKNGTQNLVGNILGLQDLGPWIAGVLLVALIVCAAIPRIRRFIIGHLAWVIGILLFGAVIVGLLLAFVPHHCA